MTIHIAGTVPPKDRNGMYDVEERWTEIPDPEAVFAIVRIERSGLTLKPGDKPRQAVMTFTDIVLVDGPEAAAFQHRVAGHTAARAGATTLDMPEEPEPDFDTPLAKKGEPYPDEDPSAGSRRLQAEDDEAWEAAAPNESTVTSKALPQ